MVKVYREKILFWVGSNKVGSVEIASINNITTPISEKAHVERWLSAFVRN
jgi:hypothetical protein